MSIRRSLAWMIGSQGGLFVLQFGGSVVLARMLSPYEMGVYAIAAAVIGIIGIVQAFGLALFVIRETEAGPDMLASAFTMNMALSALIAAATAGLSVLGGSFLNEPGVRHVMLVLAITPLIGILDFRPLALLERGAEFRKIATVNIIRSAVTNGVTMYMAFTGHSYMSIAWGAVAGSLANAAGAMIAGRHHVSFRVSTAAWRHILRFGMQQLAIQGVNAVTIRIAEFILGRMLGLDALGLWGRATSLNNLLWSNIHMVVGRVMLVNLAEQRRAGLSLRTSYLRTMEVLTAVLWPSFAGLATLAGPFINIVYGKAWVAATAPLAGLAMAAIVLVSLTMAWEVFVVCNETRRQVRFEFIRSAIGLVLFVGGCTVGLTAASFARLGEAVLSVTLNRSHVERMTDTSWPDYVRIYRHSALATAAACGPALALMVAWHWSAAVPFPQLAAAVGTGVALWLATLKLLGHPLAEELGRVVATGRQAAGPA